MLLIVGIIAAVLIAGAIVSTLWSSTLGPIGEPAWIENFEHSRWFEFLDTL